LDSDARAAIGYDGFAMVKELEQEIALYDQTKPRLLREGRAGQFVLIKGRELIGLFSTKEEAYHEGFRRFHAGPFFVKRIQKVEPVEVVPLAIPSRRADL
jgi:hypothetical protein